jgi:hypothetical protein
LVFANIAQATLAGAGAHTISARVTDAVGNVGTSVDTVTIRSS